MFWTFSENCFYFEFHAYSDAYHRSIIICVEIKIQNVIIVSPKFACNLIGDAGVSLDVVKNTLLFRSLPRRTIFA